MLLFLFDWRWSEVYSFFKIIECGGSRVELEFCLLLLFFVLVYVVICDGFFGL